jgi:outer membrane phospholipase A
MKGNSLRQSRAAVIAWATALGHLGGSPAPAMGGDSTTNDSTTTDMDLWSALQGQRSFSGRLSPHQPIYVIAGPDRPEVKFQVSLKYRLLSFGGQSGAGAPLSLQAAYTQRSLWDVGGPSSPFYDTSYMPELFVQWVRDGSPSAQTTSFSWLGLQSGLRHESNGRDGAASRSLNEAYMTMVFSVGSINTWHLVLAPEIYAYIGDLSDNPDIHRYRGNTELRAVVAKGKAASLMLTWIPGERFEHGSRQLDLTVPVRLPVVDFSMFLLLQYFDGYGESLLSYNQHTSKVRAGIELVR